MTRFQIAILSAAGVASLAILIAQRNETRLRTENHFFQQQIRQAAENAEPAAPSETPGQVASTTLAESQPAASSPVNNSGELLRLRGEVAVMRRELAEMLVPSNLYRLDSNAQVQALAEARQSGTLMSKEETLAGFPQGSWTFSGYATPKAAAQSLMWALSQGDAKAIFQSYTPDALQWKSENQWKGKSETEIVEGLKEAMKQLTGFRIEGQMFNPQRPDTIDFILSAQDAAGKSHRTGLNLKKIGDEWKCTLDSLTLQPGR